MYPRQLLGNSETASAYKKLHRKGIAKFLIAMPGDLFASTGRFGK